MGTDGNTAGGITASKWCRGLNSDAAVFEPAHAPSCQCPNKT